MQDPLFGHVTLVSARADLSWLVECTCTWRATAETVPQADELIASHDRFVLTQRGVDFKEQEST
jgi:hypothetical protein